MRRRIACLLLAALVLVPAIPAAAAEPMVPTGDRVQPRADADRPSPPRSPRASRRAEPTAAPVADPPTPRRHRSPTASADPITVADPPTPLSEATGGVDPTGKYIVVLRSGTDPNTVVSHHRVRDRIQAKGTFTRAFRGFSATLSKAQRSALLADPNVTEVVPDELIHLTSQTTPTGVSRIGARLSPVAKINGLDERVDADVAIVDTGVSYHPDLNVAGGYNCTTSNAASWGDANGHGTHVAGTVAALDNTIGVVGVAPGARIWAVRILNADGYGLLSWYVCGLDWVLAQRDPNDSSKPLIEAVNMSVAKAGSDDSNCGLSNHDVLHQAVCRLVAGGITVVAAAANDHASARGPRAGGLQRGHHGLGARRHGRQARRPRRQPLLFVGRLRQGRHVRRLQQLRQRRRPHRAGQVHLVDEARGLVPVHVGDVHGRPGGDRRGRALQGGPPERDPGRGQGGAPVPRHLRLEDLHGPGSVSREAARRLAARAARDVRPRHLGARLHQPVGRHLAAAGVDHPQQHVLRAGPPDVTSLPSGWSASLGTASLLGWTANRTTISVNVPSSVSSGTYHVGVSATNQGRTETGTVTVVVENDKPTVPAPVGVLRHRPAQHVHGADLDHLARRLRPDQRRRRLPVRGQRRRRRLGRPHLGERQHPDADPLAPVRPFDRPARPGPRQRRQLRRLGRRPPTRSGRRSSTTAAARSPTRVRGRSPPARAAYARSLHSARYTGRDAPRTRSPAAARAWSSRPGGSPGSVDVYVDGVLAKAALSLRASATHGRQILFATSLAYGKHTIKVRTRNLSLVQLDGFIAVR